MAGTACAYCGSSRLIKTGEGYKCRDAACEGAKQVMQPGVICERCEMLMDYRGLTAWGEPTYVCSTCGHTTKL